MSFKEGIILYSNDEHIKIKVGKDEIVNYPYEEWCDDCKAPAVGEKVYVTDKNKLISTTTCSKVREQKDKLTDKYLGDNYEVSDSNELACTIKEKRRFRVNMNVLFFLTCTIVAIVLHFNMVVPKIKDFWSISAIMFSLVTLYYYMKKEKIEIICNHEENRIDVLSNNQIIEKQKYKDFA